jgi:hypothetical protein
MHFSKTLQYAVSGVLAVYIVFFTRPAPQAVVGLLSSSIAQLAALAVIVYVGASMSLLVALVAAVALVLSIPAREYLDVTAVPESLKEVAKDMKDAAVVAGATSAADKLDKVAATGANKDEEKKNGEPTPAGHKMADGVAHAEPSGSTKKEGFGNMGAPF